MAKALFLTLLLISYLGVTFDASLGIFSGDLTNVTTTMPFPSFDASSCTTGDARAYSQFSLTVPDSSPLVVFRKLVRSDWGGVASVIIYSSFQSSAPCQGRVASLSTDDEQAVLLSAGKFTVVVTTSSTALRGPFVVEVVDSVKGIGSTTATWTPQSDPSKCDQVAPAVPLLFIKYTPSSTGTYDLHIVADTSSLSDASTVNIFYWIFATDFPASSTSATACSLPQPPVLMLPLQTPRFRGASTVATVPLTGGTAYTIFVALVQGSPLTIPFGLVAEPSTLAKTDSYTTAGFHAPTIPSNNAAGCLDQGNATGNWLAFSFTAVNSLTFASLWSTDDIAGSQLIAYEGDNTLSPPQTCNGYLGTSLVSNTGLASQADTVMLKTTIGSTYTIVMYSLSNTTQHVSMGLFLLPYVPLGRSSNSGQTRSPTIGIDAGVYKDLYLHLTLTSCMAVPALKSALSNALNPAVPISQVQVIQIQCDQSPIVADAFVSSKTNYTVADSSSVYALHNKVNSGALKSDGVTKSEVRNAPPKKKAPKWLIALIVCAVIFVVLAAAAAFVVLMFMKPKKEVEEQRRRQSLLTS